MRVCYFGRYDPQYSRNVIIARCLERAGAVIVQVRDDRSLLARTPALLRRARRERFDAIVVGFRAHADMFLAGRLAKQRGVPLIFDPLTSRYEEKVVDRQLVKPNSWLARWYRFSDAAGCRTADRILLETDAQIAYFAETFGIECAKCRRVWLGANDEIMRPALVAPPNDVFTVFFYGRFSPLHGIEHIIRAASLLEARQTRVRIVLVGGGQTYAAMRTLAEELRVTNVEFVDPVPFAALAGMMARANVCLGSFGTTARAQRVIPNKVFDALAVGRAVIAADTPAAREALTHAHDAWLCRAGDGEALADAMETLARNPALCQSLAANGHQLFVERFSMDAMTRELAAIVAELVRDPRAHSVLR